MNVQEFQNILNDENKLNKIVNIVNKTRKKVGLSELSVDVIRTEYTLAKQVEELKASGDTVAESNKRKELVVHQRQYGL